MLLPGCHGPAGLALFQADWFADSERLLRGPSGLGVHLVDVLSFCDRFEGFFSGATNRPVGLPVARLKYFVHYLLQ